MSPSTSGGAGADDEGPDLVYLGAGPLAAILLGMGMVPLRGFTHASNFTFAFVVLTIVVAEYGGRRAALATAVASALSLDFFLTEPYLKLSIASKHDVIAFCGLALCGTVAAALASERGRRTLALKTARAHLELLHSGLRELDHADPAGAGVKRLLDDLCMVTPLRAATVKDATGRLLASSGDASARTSPAQIQVGLRKGSHAAGALEAWVGGTPLRADARRLLDDLAALLGVRLAGVERR